MTSIIKLQAFSGADGESPPCYLLQVDEFRFLLDCGWDEQFSMTHIENLKKHMHQIDAVLLSYPDPIHLGALPYMVGKCGLTCPIYATIPVYKMGQMFMYDLYQSRHNTEDFDLFTLDDVDSAFDKILQLKYSQTVGLKGKGHGMQITPLPAGHMIGGTIWKIVKDGEEEIIYMVDYNHKKERHLNGCVLDGISRPHLLITDSFNANYNPSRRKVRDEQLMINIVQTMRNGGNVLIAVDTAGRVLELAQLLDQMWRTAESGLMAYSLALLNNVSYNVVEFAKSQVEWMSDKVMRAFEDRRNNPFQFKHLQLCHSMAELTKVPEPKKSQTRILNSEIGSLITYLPIQNHFISVVLASVADMECGFSRELFLQWCGDAKNTIILTNRTSPGTLSRTLIDNPNQKSILTQFRRRVRLEGAELEEYLRSEKEKDAEESRKKAEQAKKEKEELESSDESDEEITDEFLGGSKAKRDLMVKSEVKGRTGFFKQAKKAYPMFPCIEERIKWDDYGEIIRQEDFMIIETTQTEEEKKEVKAEEDATMKDIAEVPTKCIVSRENFDVLANIQYIDFEGRSDGESMRKILAQIKPRQLILVRGSRQSTESLADYCFNTKDLVQGMVYVPKVNDTVDATTESHIYQVKLKDSIVSALRFAKAKDTEIAWVDATLDLSHAKTDTSAMIEALEASKAKGLQDKMDTDSEESMDVVPALAPLAVLLVEGHTSVFINEPKLSDFKQVLMREGIQAEFSGGVLVCNNVVAVKRNEAGRLQLEGCLGEDYYKVRDLLYEQFAII